MLTVCPFFRVCASGFFLYGMIQVKQKKKNVCKKDWRAAIEQQKGKKERDRVGKSVYKNMENLMMMMSAHTKRKPKPFCSKGTTTKDQERIKERSKENNKKRAQNKKEDKKRWKSDDPKQSNVMQLCAFLQIVCPSFSTHSRSLCRLHLYLLFPYFSPFAWSWSSPPAAHVRIDAWERWACATFAFKPETFLNFPVFFLLLLPLPIFPVVNRSARK